MQMQQPQHQTQEKTPTSTEADDTIVARTNEKITEGKPQVRIQPEPAGTEKIEEIQEGKE